MIPVVAVAGFSNAGKTTLMEKLIAELSRRGYRVGTVKHHHTDIDLDKPGKDSWRHAQAGAKVTLLAAPNRLAKFVQGEQIDLNRALREINDVDIILVEGFKGSSLPKIEVFRSEVHDKLITPPENLLAVASDIEFPGFACYGLEDISGLGDLIENRFLQKSGLSNRD